MRQIRRRSLLHIIIYIVFIIYSVHQNMEERIKEMYMRVLLR